MIKAKKKNHHKKKHHRHRSSSRERSRSRSTSNHSRSTSRTRKARSRSRSTSRTKKAPSRSRSTSRGRNHHKLNINHQEQRAIDVPSTSSVESVPRSATNDQTSASAPTAASRNRFFEALREAESKKGPVGTFHSTIAKPTPPSAEPQYKDNDWVCSRCSTKNFKSAFQCHKCSSMRPLN